MCYAQGQRVCLEAAVPGLLNAIVENANHSEDSFLQDPDIMVVYLEQLVRSSNRLFLDQILAPVGQGVVVQAATGGYPH